MSMVAEFVQIDPAEIKKLQRDESFAEQLFTDAPSAPHLNALFNPAMQERVRNMGPQMMAGALANLPPELRKQIEASMGRTQAMFASGGGGEQLLKMMQARAQRAQPAGPTASRKKFSLYKEWNGVHYLLCGEKESGETPLSQAVLGGTEIGDDPEGFSGYGPARYFTADHVAAISQALSQPGLESEAEGRFDAERMNQLDIYPGWEASHKDSVMQALRALRDFYADAARNGRVIVTCLV